MSAQEFHLNLFEHSHPLPVNPLLPFYFQPLPRPEGLPCKSQKLAMLRSRHWSRDALADCWQGHLSEMYLGGRPEPFRQAQGPELAEGVRPRLLSIATAGSLIAGNLLSRPPDREIRVTLRICVENHSKKLAR